MSFTQQYYVKERLSLNLARLKKGGKKFEIIIEDPDKALELREGKDVNIHDVLQSEEIFSDAKKSELAKEADIQQTFNTVDPLEVAKKIIRKGEVQLTAEYRKKLFDQKKRKIIEYIHQNAIDPKTRLPHPVKRIELAFEEAKIHIDASDTVSWQVDRIIPKLQPILPISFSKMRLKVVIPTKYAGHAYGSLKGKYNLIKEKWLNDGAVEFEATGSAGLKREFIDLVNKLTNGEAEINDLGE